MVPKLSPNYPPVVLLKCHPESRWYLELIFEAPVNPVLIWERGPFSAGLGQFRGKFCFAFARRARWGSLPFFVSSYLSGQPTHCCDLYNVRWRWFCTGSTVLLLTNLSQHLLSCIVSGLPAVSVGQIAIRPSLVPALPPLSHLVKVLGHWVMITIWNRIMRMNRWVLIFNQRFTVYLQASSHCHCKSHSPDPMPCILYLSFHIVFVFVPSYCICISPFISYLYLSLYIVFNYLCFLLI